MSIPVLPNRYISLIILLPGCVLMAMTAPFGSTASKQPDYSATAAMPEPQLPVEAITRMTTYFEDRRSSRYMEENCIATTYPGWEALPLKECTYSRKGANDPVKKTAKVIMLNAEPDQLARWVVSTCIEVLGCATIKCTNNMGKQIIEQSGAQFPIAGIVFEDILPPDGKYEVFAFRNGVTVLIDGVTHRGTAQPSAAQIEKSLHGDVTSTFKFARIQSTTREQYLANGGTLSVTGNAWNEVNRDLYKAAWGNNRNELMVAWAKANKTSLE